MTDQATTSPPEQPKKISLLDMIVFCEDEAGDIDIWERVLKAEGKPLYSKMARRRAVLHSVVATLELVKLHEKAFVNLVRQARAAGVGRRASIAPPSTSSTPKNVEPEESTEPSSEP